MIAECLRGIGGMTRAIGEQFGNLFSEASKRRTMIICVFRVSPNAKTLGGLQIGVIYPTILAYVNLGIEAANIYKIEG